MARISMIGFEGNKGNAGHFYLGTTGALSLIFVHAVLGLGFDYLMNSAFECNFKLVLYFGLTVCSLVWWGKWQFWLWGLGLLCLCLNSGRPKAKVWLAVRCGAASGTVFQAGATTFNDISKFVHAIVRQEQLSHSGKDC